MMKNIFGSERPSYIRHGLHLNLFVLQDPCQRIGDLIALGGAEELKVIEDRLHPARKLFLLRSRKISYIPPQGNNGPRDKDLSIRPFVEDLSHAGGKSHEGLSGPCRA